MAYQPSALVEVPTKRAVWRIVLTAITATTILIALLAGGYLLYNGKTTEISHLEKQRENLLTTNETLRSRWAITRVKFQRTSVKLSTATKSFTLAKQNLTKMRKDLSAANERADANYSVGYSAGSSTGYSSGRTAGLVQGSDQLACSDDADVTWLPYCN